MNDLFEVLWDDGEVWNEFVDEWIKRHPDRVHEIVESYLDKKTNETMSMQQDEYAAFVMEKVRERIADENHNY